MILTGHQIALGVKNRDIIIDPFSPTSINPNSYNYRLAAHLKQSAESEFDISSTGRWDNIPIPQDGFVLQPQRIYLGSTVERIGSTKYVPTLMGRSSLGRIGLFLQISADLGHFGAPHCWTLELHVVQPVRIYAGMLIGQLCFWAAEGAKVPYTGRYHDFDEPVGPLFDELRP